MSLWLPVYPKPPQLLCADFTCILWGITIAHNHHIGLKVVVIFKYSTPLPKSIEEVNS